MAPKTRRGSKTKRVAKKEMVAYLDLRTWEGGQMEKRAFCRWIEEDRLLCFNHMSSDITEYPKPEGEDVIWWPECHSTPGSKFALDSSPVHVDAPGPSYEQFRTPLTSKEYQQKKDLGLVSDSMVEDALPVAESPDGAACESASASTVEGEDFEQAAARVRKVAEKGKVRRVFFVDLRNAEKDARMVKVSEMEPENFVSMVRADSLLCFNLAAHVLCHGAGATHQSNAPQMWYPYLKEEECKDFVVNELVFIDAWAEEYPTLVESCLFGEASEKYDKSIESLTKFSLGKETAVEDEEKKSDAEQRELEWHHVVSTKGKTKTTKELIVMVMETMNSRFGAQDKRFGAQDKRFDALDKRFDALDKRFDALEGKVNEVNDSLSIVAERALKSNFGLFLQQNFPGHLALQPVARLKLPYKPDPAVEKLALLCGKPERDRSRQIPLEAEIDIFVRIRVESAKLSSFESFKRLKVNLPSLARVPFGHYAIAEVTRSKLLCMNAKDYMHPIKCERTPSSKLLYKLVQLERNIRACNASLDASLVGACIISPSFMELYHPEALLDVVFSQCHNGLENLQALHKQGALWLMDI